MCVIYWGSRNGHSRDGRRNRNRAKPSRNSKPKEYVATWTNQVWSWDITYLRSSIRDEFHYLYLVVDVWSRMIVSLSSS